MTFDEMMVHGKDLIDKCEADLGRALSKGQKVDLLADNTDWTLATCQNIVNKMAPQNMDDLR